MNNGKLDVDRKKGMDNGKLDVDRKKGRCSRCTGRVKANYPLPAHSTINGHATLRG